MTVHLVGNLLCALDLQDQLKKGNIGPLKTTGDRKHHGEQRRGPCSLEQPGLAPKVAVRDVRRPDQFLSERTLVYLGFTRDKAAELWGQWRFRIDTLAPWNHAQPAESVSQARGLQRCFLALALGVLEGEEGTTNSSPTTTAGWPTEDHGTTDPRRALMDAWGIRQRMQDSILNPFVCMITSRELCARWVRDSIVMRFFALLRMWEESLLREEILLEGEAAAAPQDAEARKRWIDLQEMGQRIRFGDLQILRSVLWWFGPAETSV